MKKYYLIVLIIFLCKSTFAQGEAAVPFLLNQQSPLFYGAGEIGTAVPMQDPIGFYYNPAQLGCYSRNNNFSVFFMPNKTTIYKLPSDYVRIHAYGYNAPNDITSNTYGISLGYNFNSNKSGIPLSIGAGFLHYKINYNELYIPIWDSPTPNIRLNSYDLFDCYSIGVGYNYYCLFNFGLSVKSFKSFQSNVPTAQSQFSSLTASGTAYDFGAMIIAPFDKLLLNGTNINIGDLIFSPSLKSSIGYSISNIGKKIFYVDPAQSDPISRTARLGYSIDLGFKTRIYGTELPVVDYSFSAETENILVNNDSLGNTSYKGLLGDINFVNNLILLNGKDDVIIHKGHIFNFFKTIIIVTGRISGGNLYNIKTSGWAVSSRGLFSILADNISGPVLNYFFKHFNVEYYKSDIFGGPMFNPKPEGVAVYFKGIGI